MKIENIDQSNCVLSKNYLNIPIVQKTRSTPTKMRKNSTIMQKLKDKEVFEKKFHSKFLPIHFSFKSSNDKKDIEWNIKIINRKLNIIHILNNLEQIERIKKELDLENWSNNNNLSSYLSIIPENEIKTNNFILDYENGKKKTNILTKIFTKESKK